MKTSGYCKLNVLDTPSRHFDMAFDVAYHNVRTTVDVEYQTDKIQVRRRILGGAVGCSRILKCLIRDSGVSSTIGGRHVRRTKMIASRVD